MKRIIKGRWAIFAVWLVVTVLLSVFQPDINVILQQRGQSPLNDDSPSVIASSILKKMEATNGTDNLVVFYNQDKISDDEMKSIGEAVQAMKDSSTELGIDKIIDPFGTPEAKSSLISSDGTTLMVSFKLDKGARDINDIKNAFEEKLQNAGVEHYLTGEDFITGDYLEASIAGVEKSAVLTVLFILVILIIMFRSVVTPLVSLLTVAVAYLTSMGITAQLIDRAGFPVTTLTQVLMILILFGIGTDYNILLFNRFKEELSHGLSVDDAIIRTYKTAGKTIAFSILTVLIAFFSLIFSESPIYKSAISVVIGGAMLLLEIVTLTPFVMKQLGPRIFWPSKNANGHKESRIWGGITAFSTKRAVVSVLLTVAVIGVSVVFYQQKLNFDQVGELGDAYPASKGFNIVAEHFGKGQAMPSTLVIESGSALDNNDALSVIDKVTEKIKAIDGVEQVSSVTQPEGKQIDDLYISSQMTSVSDGLSQMQDGLNQLGDGFGGAEAQLGGADFSQVGDMAAGTAQLHDAVTALAGGLSQLQAGLDGSASDAQTLSGGLKAIETNLSQMSGGLKTLADNYSAMQSGYLEMGKNYQSAAGALLGIKSALSQMQGMAAALGESVPSVKGDANYQGMKASIDTLLSSLGNMTPEGMEALNSNYNAVTAGFNEANTNLAAMSAGLSQLAAGLKSVESGLGQASDGIGTIVTNMNKVASGLDQMKAGQEQLASGLEQFGAFGSQLTQVADALKQISDGLGQSKDFLTQFSADKTFHMPDEALASADFKPALDTFMSGDRTITKMIIVLKDDPYSKDAVNTIKEINDAVSSGLKGTVLSDAGYGISGPSSTTCDMNDILSRDLNRMIIIVLIGVFLVLMLVIRSFWTSVMITLSLVGAYFAATFISNSIFIGLLHYPGVSSYVPFFSFIVIVALGVDYSIFLMMRFREFGHMKPKEAIVLASRQIGGVVLSAAVILGGTFATLMPSGMLLLTELAVTVITGLIILCFIMLPLFLPATISLMSRLPKSGVDTEDTAQDARV
ncbi:putative drug exporter of the RND superfamily [Sporobacter termitidis DSM 10068]|uniref:Putative drug exporter of the RND superfamily n=1 Tax=Sporobacter termitidis DSM 10068 TaxID=1123282 RepID=A0A1M5ZD41_9FIRM|nr:MMPL family transporter [Sporobacter termitidis]SHI22089.1 putative drug exporter of the RND superfamily [Sporobacter termitidis DSM 10068]